MGSIPLKPSPGYILASPEEPPKSKLTYVNPNEEAPKKAKVLAISDDYTTEFNAILACPVQVGDVIAHASVGYETIKENGKEYRVIPFTKIIGIYEK